jgi:hypothetical protein
MPSGCMVIECAQIHVTLRVVAGSRVIDGFCDFAQNDGGVREAFVILPQDAA